jgi:Na+/H+ antiporter NhaD/arsenite permease-like protein
MDTMGWLAVVVFAITIFAVISNAVDSAVAALIGGLERMDVLDALAQQLRPVFTENYALAATLMYWITIPIVGIVEHDAYILTFLHTVLAWSVPFTLVAAAVCYALGMLIWVLPYVK